jgi:hypothetical protein
VEHEGIGVGAEVGDDEGDLVFHQAADEVDVADSRSSLATMIGAFALRAASKAAFRWGRRWSSSLPLWTSVKV